MYLLQALNLPHFLLLHQSHCKLICMNDVNILLCLPLSRRYPDTLQKVVELIISDLPTSDELEIRCFVLGMAC